MTVPVLDAAAAERLHRIGGDALVSGMMRAFLQNGAERIASARSAAAAGSARSVADAAHALKSSAGNIGALRLMESAASIEARAREEASDASALAEELAASFDEAAAAVRAHPHGTG